MNKPVNTYLGDGVSKQFDITFPYLRRNHIFVFINNQPVQFGWINNSRIELENPPPSNIIVKIERHRLSPAPIIHGYVFDFSRYKAETIIVYRVPLA